MTAAPGPASFGAAWGRVVRPRTDADLPALVALLRRVHEASGYPGHWPEPPDPWIARPHTLAAWVAAGETGELVGHVALHDAGEDRSAPLMAELAGLDVGEVDVVARLFVAPESQGGGVGRALLEVAAQAARARGRVPVLDVLADSAGALAFYHSCGWRRCGEFEFAFRDGVPVPLVAYVGPG